MSSPGRPPAVPALLMAMTRTSSGMDQFPSKSARLPTDRAEEELRTFLSQSAPVSHIGTPRGSSPASGTPKSGTPRGGTPSAGTPRSITPLRGRVGSNGGILDEVDAVKAILEGGESLSARTTGSRGRAPPQAAAQPLILAKLPSLTPEREKIAGAGGAGAAVVSVASGSRGASSTDGTVVGSPNSDSSSNGDRIGGQQHKAVT
jgi:hypothetical protein